MNRDNFKELLIQKCGFIDNYDRHHFCGRRFDKLSLAIEVLPDDNTIGIQFYSSCELNNVQDLNGPWLTSKLLNKFNNTTDIKVISTDRKITKPIRNEGRIAQVSFSTTWDNTDDKAIIDFVDQLATFLVDFGNTESIKKEKVDYNNKSVFVKGYAERRRKSGSGLSKEEIQEINRNDSGTQPAANTNLPTPSPEPKGDDDNPRNLIYFGAPGTGKSYKLKVAVEGETDKDGNIVKDNDKGIFIEAKGKEILERRYERVTFYPTYSYAQFVGCYKPVMHGNEIAYEFVPGPFLRVLVDSLKDLKDLPTDTKDHSHDHCLVIEEINRANAAAVFGDVFQLLDRKDNGESEYDIAASEDIRRYLTKEIGDNLKTEAAREFLKVEKDDDGKICLDKNGIWKSCRLRIPSNMYIWATMNSADQGVFPLDTAFKRRWEFKYVGIDADADKCENLTLGDKHFSWNKVRKFINKRLSDNGVNEDKLMGPWFVKQENGNGVSEKQFNSKVLMYLWEDAARICRRKFFSSEIKTYADLTGKWPDVFNGVENWDNVKSDWMSTDKKIANSGDDANPPALPMSGEQTGTGKKEDE